MKFSELSFFLDKPVAVQCKTGIAGVGPLLDNGQMRIQTVKVELPPEEEGGEPQQKEMAFGMPGQAYRAVPGPGGQQGMVEVIQHAITCTIHEIPDCPSMVCLSSPRDDGTFVQYCVPIDDIACISILPEPQALSEPQQRVVAPGATN